MVDKEIVPVPALTSLYVYMTDQCNCSCKHCWIVPESSAGEAENPNFLSTDAFAAAVEEAKPLGLRSVKWTGGEPTLHPNFSRLLDLQKKHGLNGQVETNGILMTRTLATLLADSGVTHISVSLDGARPDTHDSIRGRRGAHRRTLAGIRNLVDAGFQPQLIMSLMRENIGELEDLLRLAEKLGAGSVKLNIVQPTQRGMEINADGTALSVSELIGINHMLECEIKPRYSFEIFMDIPMAFRSLKNISSGDGCLLCGIKNIMGLLANGSYALCGIGQAVPELVFGHTDKGVLAKIWEEHRVIVQIREELPTKLQGACGGCLMVSACLGACVAQNYYRTKNLFDTFWFCDIAEKQGLFPASRRYPLS